ncbi:MAG: hypothetical protein EXR69_04205 [Myxococcales bacterium]|nr:hypothetical protein [Myxococcales bacterium]
MYSLLCALAIAHPGVHEASAHPTPGILGQRLDVHVEKSAAGTSGSGLRVRVVYSAEVPERRVLAEVAAESQNGEKSYASRRLLDLADGVRVRWDGVTLATTSVPVEHAARNGEPGFLEFHVEMEAPLPSAHGTLDVTNGNFPDEDCFFATSVALPGSLVVTGTSLAHVRDGLLRDSTHGAWTRKDAARELSLSLRPAQIWEERDGEHALPDRMAGLSSLAMPRWVQGGVVVAAALLGGAIWRLWARR